MIEIDPTWNIDEVINQQDEVQKEIHTIEESLSTLKDGLHDIQRKKLELKAQINALEQKAVPLRQSKDRGMQIKKEKELDYRRLRERYFQIKNGY
jgi:chromosome segregation ATPase